MKKPRGKADQEAWFRRFGADPKTGRIRGKILTGSCPVGIGLRSLERAILANRGKGADLDAHIDLDLGCPFDVGNTGLSARYRRRTRTTRGRRVYIPRDMYRLFGLIIGRLTFPEFRFTSMHDGRQHGRIDERHGRTKRIGFYIVNGCAVDWPEWFVI